MRHYYKTKRQPLLGDDTPPAAPTTFTDVVSNPNLKLASGAALTFHGYRRTGSVVWAIVYGLIGKWKPQIAVPIAVAQGFGKTKGGGS